MQPSNCKTLIAFLFGMIILVPSAFAGERRLTQDDQGFCTSLPYLERAELSQHLEAVQLRLKARQANLTEQVNSQHFGIKDLIITLAVPGGSLYAIVKHKIQLDRRKELTQVTEEIDRLSIDLLAFEGAAPDVRIARNSP